LLLDEQNNTLGLSTGVVTD